MLAEDFLREGRVLLNVLRGSTAAHGATDDVLNYRIPATIPQHISISKHLDAVVTT
jgi:hypothetical protein